MNISELLRNAGPMFDGGTDSTREEITKEWADLFQPYEVEEWINIGCWNAVSAKQLADAGFKPKYHKLSSVYSFNDAMYWFCNGDISLNELKW